MKHDDLTKTKTKRRSVGRVAHVLDNLQLGKDILIYVCILILF